MKLLFSIVHVLASGVYYRERGIWHAPVFYVLVAAFFLSSCSYKAATLTPRPKKVYRDTKQEKTLVASFIIGYTLQAHFQVIKK